MKYKINNVALKNIRSQRNFTQSEIAEKLQITRSAYANYELGYTQPPLDKILKIAQILDAPMENFIDNKTYWQAYDSELGDAKLKALAEEVQAYDTGTTQINVYGTIPAGVPIQAIQDIDDTISIPTQWLKGGNEFIALRVKGDSMYPRYEDGDVVIIQLQPDCENGEDCACYVNGDDVTLKRAYKSDGSITLQPLNSAYRPMTFKHPGEVVILGKVVEQRRSTKY